MRAESLVPSEKNSSGAYQFLLLARIYRLYRVDKAVGVATPYFYEDELSIVQHNKINFAAAASEVAMNRKQSLANEES